MLKTSVNTALRWHRPLVILGIAMAALVPVTLIGMLVDDRVLVGAPIWTKPFKFAVSLGTYAVSLAWFLTFLNRGRRIGWWAGTAMAVALGVEMVAILVQVLRGKRSHFNIETQFDSALYSFMGQGIIVLWVAHAVIALLLLWTRFDNRALAWAIRLGLAISLLGLTLGTLMTQPQPGQTGKSGTVGAHSVGAPDGGEHLPVTGWSTEVGDLRVPHFVGIHALQAIPVLVALFGRRADARLAWVLSGSYFGLFALTTWQALRGQPVTDPDALTLLAFAALAALTVVAVRLAALPRSPQGV
ncbi:hypothetical protein FKR81_29400 [Lentzea tibetensis]|uniref:Uncharacterized protein n=1 Tax=Lentzea tibetensis TaxID=2591470 RepID=A0A563ELY2_9PSEU|nr:hypothetical protein FKR81_29400 [Lentzea tibetensis]